MLLTNCAACAAPLPHRAKQCSRCKTRYCGPACQKEHWDAAGGHENLCKKIKKGGGAEQYHADKKYKEAVAEAVEACRGRHEGQKCYICLEAVHPRTGEGLVRGCACGDRDGVSSPELGVAHVSCLARQAKILRQEFEENNLGSETRVVGWKRWHTCGLCEQQYHGVVRYALGWACWKTYVGRSEADVVSGLAMAQLGNGLFAARHYEDALSVYEAELAMKMRLGAPARQLLVVRGNIANAYFEIGRKDQALQMWRDIYSGRLKLLGEEHLETIRAACNYASSLAGLQRFEEAKSFLRKTMPVARRVLGEEHRIALRMRRLYARALYSADGATLDDLREAVTTIEDVQRTTRRVFGGAHPLAAKIEDTLKKARAALHARETPPSDSLEDGDLDDVENA